MYLALGVVLLLAAGLLFWQAWRQRRAAGLPAGRVIYADTSRWTPLEEPLYDPQLGIIGRPDYLIEEGGTLIPVEVKSSRVSDAPYDAHIYQLAAYCLLVERQYGKRPRYGVLHYPTRTFAIDYSRALEQSLLETIEQMRQLERRKEVHRSHEAAARCRGCGYRAACPEKLA
jgi:CRISPR-associated exonuclease Cas4